MRDRKARNHHHPKTLETSTMDLTLTTAADWTTATCVQTGADPETMQPEQATQAEVDAAKRLCAGCPMFTECRDLADRQEGAYGVHAGEWYGQAPAWVVQCATEGCEETTTTTYCSTECRDVVRRERARVRMAENRHKESVPA